MSTKEPKFGYAFGTFATIMVLILDFLVILSSVSNCIVYNKIVSGEPNSDISIGWGRFMLGVNIVVAIFAFIIFFWILYILFTGKKSIGAELSRKRELGGIGSYLGDLGADVKSRIQSNYISQGVSPRQAAVAAAATVNAAAAGDPNAAAMVAAARGASTVRGNPLQTLKAWVESQGDNSGWDDIMSARYTGGNCSDPDFQGCSSNLECSNGSTKLPCNPPTGATGNDQRINQLYTEYMASL